MAIAMVDAGCSGRQSNNLRNSPANRKESASSRNAFLHAALLGNRWRLTRSRNHAKVLARVTQTDAAHVADFYSCHLVTRYLGRDNRGLALASAAIFSRTRSGVTQFDQRSRTLTR